MDNDLGPKLTPERIDHYRKQQVTASKGVPVRFLHNGQALDICSGQLASRGSNVMFHPVFWNFTRDTAKEIATMLGVKAVFSE